MSTIMPAFLKFPKEGVLIGRLLAGYGELEFGLCHAVANAAGDFDVTLKVMFRTRGETQRVQLADAMGRKHYEARGLGTEFSEAIGAVRYCLKIRNQFAHCQWHDDWSGKLGFVDLEELAKENDEVKDLGALTIFHIDVPTLEAQEAYFVFTDRLIGYLNFEWRFRAGKLSNQPLPTPKKANRPPTHIP